MAKQRKRREDEAALFIRLPREEADRLDRFVFEHRVPKRDVVRRLMAEHLDDADVLFARPVPPTRLPPRGDVVVGHAGFAPAAADEVLTVDEAAELLQVEPGDVSALAEAGELPGRKIGEEWRFLRRAVLAWLGGGAPPDQAA
jgi:excisionase family DNA binding protein